MARQEDRITIRDPGFDPGSLLVGRVVLVDPVVEAALAAAAVGLEEAIVAAVLAAADKKDKALLCPFSFTVSF